MRVELTGVLRVAADNEAAIEVEAQTIRELLDRVIQRYPAMQAQMDGGGIAVSINGQIYRDDWRTPIPADAEVVLLPRIPGG